MDKTCKGKGNGNLMKVISYLPKIELIKDITRDSVAECLESLVSSKTNKEYRKLTVQVVGASNPEDGTPPALEGLLGWYL